MPQLVYWKVATGSWVFDVGSKWYFLSPYFRVLFGFEKGWFIYTPLTILFVAGLWKLKKMAFGTAFLVFCVLNLWIIMAWSDWHYGASFSCRALVQSYPVFAFSMAAILARVWASRWKNWILSGFLCLVLLNLFQIHQYNTGVLRADENSFDYYKSIFLNPYAPPFRG